MGCREYSNGDAVRRSRLGEFSFVSSLPRGPNTNIMEGVAMARKREQRKGRGRGRQDLPKSLKRVNLDAAGIDVGSSHHYVAVPEDRDEEPVRRFESFTNDLHRLADWLEKCGIDTVAMESTGVYWIPLYEILEERGFEVVLVNAKDFKSVPGRKTDVLDCQWLQELHTYGLLRASFRPDADVVALRAYVRHRDMLVKCAAQHIQHMQKALSLMNLQLHNVISDVTGATGMRIIRAIVSGNTDPEALAEHRDFRCKASRETIVESLTGNYRPEHIFALRQAIELYDFYHRQMASVDGEIEQLLSMLEQTSPVREELPPAKPRRLKGNEPAFDITKRLYALTGTDLTEITAIGPYSALKIISEIGTDMTRWPNADHFTSWATLAPKNKITGGRLISSRTRSSANRFAEILRMAAMTIGKTDTYLGAFYRRKAARRGKAKAITATARKLAVIIYTMLARRVRFFDPGVRVHDENHRKRLLKNLSRQAKLLGLQLVPVTESDPLSVEVT
jgi:transposase